MRVKCNMCEKIFNENEIVVNEDEVEICPYCHTGGCISDYPETVDDFAELYGHIPDPYGYKKEVDDVEHNVIAVCRKCGHWVGTFHAGYGRIFSSSVDFGKPEEGLCDQCIEENK